MVEKQDKAAKHPSAEDQLQDIAATLIEREGFEIGDSETIAGATLRVIAQLDAECAELQDALASSEASIRGYKSAATKAKRGTAFPSEKRTKPREVGPLGAKDAEAAAELIGEAIAGEVELVASDGERELTDLAPQIVVGREAWRPVSGGRLQLIPGLLLEAGEIDAPGIEVIGFGMFAAGEQIGWCPLVEPITVPRQSQVRVDNSIAF